MSAAMSKGSVVVQRDGHQTTITLTLPARANPDLWVRFAQIALGAIQDDDKVIDSRIDEVPFT